MKNIFLLVTLFLSFNSFSLTKNVMAPLLVEDFTAFKQELLQVKELGAHAVSTDIWWGLIEKSDNQFDWSYYQKLSDVIIEAGLKWAPILSFHQCGGNVGDTCNIPIPSWLWSKYAPVDIRYKSEQGNFSHETVSAFATPFVLNEYRDVFKSFNKNFAAKALHMQEINISLGPAGELRYPSYNSHDQGSGYPSRGAIQAYSDLAIESFQAYVENKYKTIAALNKSWGFGLNSFAQVFPPNPSLFFPNQEQHSNYGIDFYAWYSGVLRSHGKSILTEGILSLKDFNTAIGAKIPGIHWRLSPGGDRLAELNAGLISADKKTWNDVGGHGYDQLIELFREIKTETNYEKLILHFTCLEKDNLEDGNHGMSYAKALVFWIANLANSKKVEIKGENALAGPMQSQKSWENIQNALTWANYSGITILRVNDVLSSETARNGFKALQ